jgi:prepilin-type N-terminal cleavage/methylation domain-containing protein/prepilin-type processing-associated H-X9-DG protein
MTMKTRGFSMIELLVAIAIVATLAGIGIPVTRSVLAKSRESACLGNLRSLGIGLESYLQDHNRVLPELEAGRNSKSDDAPVLETVLIDYVENENAFRCPQDSAEFAKTGSSYLWNSTQSGLPVSKLAFFGITDRPDKIPLIFDKEAWHPGGTNFLYADLSGSNRVRFAAGN